MFLREFNDFFAGILCVSALWQKVGEKGISAAPVYTGEKPTVETVRGEIANPDENEQEVNWSVTEKKVLFNRNIL